MISRRLLALLAVLCLCAFSAGFVSSVSIWQEDKFYELRTGRVKFIDIEARSTKVKNNPRQQFHLKLSFTPDGNANSRALPLFEDGHGDFKSWKNSELRDVASQITKQSNFSAYCSAYQCVITKGISTGRKLWLITFLALSLFFIYYFFSRRPKK